MNMNERLRKKMAEKGPEAFKKLGDKLEEAATMNDKQTQSLEKLYDHHKGKIELDESEVYETMREAGFDIKEGDILVGIYFTEGGDGNE